MVSVGTTVYFNRAEADFNDKGIVKKGLKNTADPAKTSLVVQPEVSNRESLMQNGRYDLYLTDFQGGNLKKSYLRNYHAVVPLDFVFVFN